MYPYYDWFRSQIKKRSYIWDAYKGRGVRDHFVVLHNLTQQLLFYDVISIDIAYTMHEISDPGKCDYIWMFPHCIKKYLPFFYLSSIQIYVISFATVQILSPHYQLSSAVAAK